MGGVHAAWLVAAWCAVIFAVFGAVYCVTRVHADFKEKPALAAMNITHMLPIVALCYYGVLGYRARPDEIERRMYEYDGDAEMICVVQIALQVFVTTMALSTRDKSLFKPELLGHHTTTAALMVLCLRGTFAHSYLAVFFGVTELSTIPLNVMDTLKNFKGLRKKHPTLDFASKLSFAVLFLSLRVVLSSKVSVEFQADLYELWKDDRAASVATCAFMSVANLFVCALQLYWASLIVKGLYKIATGQDKKGKEE